MEYDKVDVKLIQREAQYNSLQFVKLYVVVMQ